MKNTEIGLVKRSTGSWYEVINSQNEIVACRLKGKIRLKGLKSTNPVAVGDKVEFDPDSKTIIDTVKRKNYIIRRSNNLSKYTHIIAANIDLAIVVCSFKTPRTSQGFVDRFLLTCEAYDIPALILLNKIDLLNDEEKEQADAFLEMYEQIGYQTLKMCAITKSNWSELEAIVKDKTSLFSGHSGVGKSTIIKELIPDVDIAIGKVSEANFKGKHTTTFAEMHLLPIGGYLIDTPGIKDFGLVNMEREELSHYFPELADKIAECKFSNCLHVNEPGCAVIAAVEQGEIDFNRYFSYISILEGDAEVNTPDYIWRKTLNEK